jgi:hypothetical protein
MKKTIAVLILCCTLLAAALFASVYILIAFPFEHSIQIASVIIMSEAIILSTPLLITAAVGISNLIDKLKTGSNHQC